MAVQRAALSARLLVAALAIVAVGVAAAAIFHHRVSGAAGSSGWAARSGGMVAAQHVVATYLTLFLVDRRGMNAIDAAALLTVLHASGTIARLGWGWVSDHLGSRR